VISLLIDLTGTGISATFGLIAYPLASIALSGLGGLIGDVFDNKTVIFSIDLIKALIVSLFMMNINLILIYILIFIMSCLDVLTSPSRKKLITGLLKKENILKGNSIIGGISGTIFLIFPLIAGNTISTYGVQSAFAIELLFIVSSIVPLLFIKPLKSNYSRIVNKNKFQKDRYLSPKNLLSTFKTFFLDINFKNIVIVSTFICCLTASVNATFFPYAFNILGVSSKTFGIMLSIFYGSNIITTVLFFIISKYCISQKVIFTISFALLSMIWFMYSFLNSFYLVCSLQFLEGICLSLITILITTKIQTVLPTKSMARMIGINEIINNAGKLLSLTCTTLLLQNIECQKIFLLNSLLIIIFCVINRKS